MLIPESKNNGKTLEAMNRIVISGTARINSIYITEKNLTVDNSDCLPNASKIPIGNEIIIPTAAIMSVSIKPPSLYVSTSGKIPKPPSRRKYDNNG